MPVGKPTDDGAIVQGSRHGTHKGGLGAVGPWDCPACGVKNEGRQPEAGCVHCGSGDPTKSQAGSPMGPAKGAPVQRAAASSTRQGISTPQDGNAGPRRAESSQPRVETATKIYRLIEYIITDPAAGAEVLRRALVGTMTFGWGTITGAIVDTTDTQQDDRLRMARMQPGVWLGNPAVSEMVAEGRMPSIAQLTRRMMTLGDPPAPAVNEFQRAAAAREAAAMDTPDTGPVYPAETRQLAQLLLDLFERVTPGSGLRAIHTLALALSNVANELEGNMEPEKFMASEECLQLANALIHLLPADWNPQPATEETAP